MNPKFDSNLKDAMSEMMGIAKKYDVGAFIDLASKTHGEFQIQFPSWSLAKMEAQENGQMGLRIRAKKGITNHENLEATVAFIMGMIDTCRINISNMEKVVSLLKEHVEIEHTPEFHFGTSND
jgi:hypothetical protein